MKTLTTLTTAVAAALKSIETAIEKTGEYAVEATSVSEFETLTFLAARYADKHECFVTSNIAKHLVVIKAPVPESDEGEDGEGEDQEVVLTAEMLEKAQVKAICAALKVKVSNLEQALEEIQAAYDKAPKKVLKLVNDTLDAEYEDIQVFVEAEGEGEGNTLQVVLAMIAESKAVRGQKAARDEMIAELNEVDWTAPKMGEVKALAEAAKLSTLSDEVTDEIAGILDFEAADWEAEDLNAKVKTWFDKAFADYAAGEEEPESEDDEDEKW